MLVAVAGVRKRSLTPSGACGAVITGTLTTARGGYGRAVLLVAFFVTSSALSRAATSRTMDTQRYADKGSQRDIAQVIANGGVSSAVAALGTEHRHALKYTGCLAAVTGDTWATEIGALSTQKPRHILTWKHVAPGTSGGVTLFGTLGSILGGVIIGVMAAAASRYDPTFHKPGWLHVATGILSGAIGSLVDSVIGATIQERRWCDRCEEYTERRRHLCGDQTRIVGGIPRLNNDAVNLLCSLTGAGIGWTVGRLSKISTR